MVTTPGRHRSMSLLPMPRRLNAVRAKHHVAQVAMFAVAGRERGARPHCCWLVARICAMSARANSDRRKRAMRVSRMFARRARQPFKIAVKVDVVTSTKSPRSSASNPALTCARSTLSFQRIFSPPLLERAQRVTHGLACVLILACPHDLFNEGVLLGSQADVTSRPLRLFPASGYRLPDLAKFAKSMVCLPRARANNSARSSKSRRQIGRGRQSPHSRSDCIGSPASASPPTTLSKYNMRGPAYGAKKGQRHQDHL